MFPILVLIALLAVGQISTGSAPAKDEGVLRIDPGITPPKIKIKRAPNYSREAEKARIQGTCILDIVIDEQGMPTNISVLSPIGFGLDEKAVEAVSTWRFKPATKDDKPVKVEATVEVNFRFLGAYFDAKTERKRAEFNVLVSNLDKQPNRKPTDKQMETIRKLAEAKYAPGEFLLGLWELSGDNAPKNERDGLALLKSAAGKNYAPAIFFLGKMQMAGALVPKNADEGLMQIKDAAILGNANAQELLGSKYQFGNGVERDIEKAKRYFRLCAASGTPECQLSLAKLLLSEPDRTEPQFLQGIAWLRLAAGHGSTEAKKLADVEAAHLDEGQKKWVSRLEQQLEQPRR
ncbi:MAG TPA: TonB family protein [Bryobacteraceae bacterium]|nr:TonB family protein [Bryobacteraceae bacterium]